MALPNPSLTWQRSPIHVCASTAQADVQTAIRDAIDDLSGDQGWSTADATGNGGGTEGAVISPPAGSPIAEFRAIIGHGSPAQAQVAPAIIGGAPDTAGSIANHPLLNIGPDGITGANNWYDPEPFGQGNRAFGFWPMWNASLITQVRAYATEETLLLTFRGAADTAWQWAYLGAIIDPQVLSDAEDDERIYGMMVAGNHSQAIPATWLQTLGDNFDSGYHRDANTACHAGCFDARRLDNRLAFFMSCIHHGGTVYQSTTSADGPDGADRGFQPIFARWTFQTQSRQWIGNLGRLRGLYLGSQYAMHAEIQTSGAVTVGYGLSGSSSGAQDAIALMNE